MKAIAIRDLRPCDLCGSPVAGKTRDGNQLDFHRVVVERHMLDLQALLEHAGLAMMLNSGALALAMGARPDATKRFAVVELVICNPCWSERLSIAEAVDADKGHDLGESPA